MSFVGARIPEVRGTGPVFGVVVLPCSLLCSLAVSPHAGQLEKADPTDQGHCQQVAKRAIKNVRTSAHIERAAKFCG